MNQPSPSYPTANADQQAEPPLLACTCGERWRWKWHEPRTPSGRLYSGRWCAPKVAPCDRCVVSPELEVEREVRARLQAADIPEPLWRFRLESNRVLVQRNNEPIEDFQARVRADNRLGVATVNYDALVRVRDWSPPKSLLLHGPPGTGKTTVMAAIARKLLTSEPDEHVDLPVANYVDPLAESYARSRGLHRAVSRVGVPQVVYHRVDELVRRETLKLRGLDPHPQVDAAKVRILLLDELGLSERPTEAEARLVERIICYRHDRGLCTVLATNRTWDELATGGRPLYGKRVADRLRDATEVALGGPSWRGE